MKDKENIKVSVCCVTYNHKAYLRECLDSLLMQETSFAYEILVHDDASTDGTTEIVRTYAALYPDRIRPVIQTQNQYTTTTRAIITTILLPLARGEYIALCEGDDFWTDPSKLQKQADILDRDPEVTLCLHPAMTRDGKGKGKVYRRYTKSQEARFTDIIRWKQAYWPTASFMYRKIRMKDYPDFCLRCHIGDAPLAHYLAMQGKVYYLNEVLSVYRKRVPGSHTDRYRKMEDATRREMARTEFEMLDGFNALTHYRYHKHFIERKLHVQAGLLAKRKRYRPVLTYEGFQADLQQVSFRRKCAIWIKIYLLPIVKGNVFKTNKQ